RLVPIAKAFHRAPLTRLSQPAALFRDSNRATDYASRERFCGKELRKRCLQTQFFRVTSVDSRHKRADQLLQELGGEFAAREGGNGFFPGRWLAPAENVPSQGPLCSSSHK